MVGKEKSAADIVRMILCLAVRQCFSKSLFGLTEIRIQKRDDVTPTLIKDIEWNFTNLLVKEIETIMSGIYCSLSRDY